MTLIHERDDSIDKLSTNLLEVLKNIMENDELVDFLSRTRKMMEHVELVDQPNTTRYLMENDELEDRPKISKVTFLGNSINGALSIIGSGFKMAPEPLKNVAEVAQPEEKDGSMGNVGAILVSMSLLFVVIAMLLFYQKRASRRSRVIGDHDDDSDFDMSKVLEIAPPDGFSFDDEEMTLAAGDVLRGIEKTQSESGDKSPDGFHLGHYHYSHGGVRYFNPKCELCLAGRKASRDALFFPADPDDLGLRHSGVNVHTCKSATCKICTREKRSVKFVSSDDPSLAYDGPQKHDANTQAAPDYELCREIVEPNIRKNDEFDNTTEGTVSNFVATEGDAREYDALPGNFHLGKYHYTHDGIRYMSLRCELCQSRTVERGLPTIKEEEEPQNNKSVPETDINGWKSEPSRGNNYKGEKNTFPSFQFLPDNADAQTKENGNEFFEHTTWNGFQPLSPNGAITHTEEDGDTFPKHSTWSGIQYLPSKSAIAKTKEEWKENGVLFGDSKSLDSNSSGWSAPNNAAENMGKGSEERHTQFDNFKSLDDSDAEEMDADINQSETYESGDTLEANKGGMALHDDDRNRSISQSWSPNMNSGSLSPVFNLSISRSLSPDPGMGRDQSKYTHSDTSQWRSASPELIPFPSNQEDKDWWKLSERLETSASASTEDSPIVSTER